MRVDTIARRRCRAHSLDEPPTRVGREGCGDTGLSRSPSDVPDLEPRRDEQPMCGARFSVFSGGCFTTQEWADGGAARCGARTALPSLALPGLLAVDRRRARCHERRVRPPAAQLIPSWGPERGTNPRRPLFEQGRRFRRFSHLSCCSLHSAPLQRVVDEILPHSNDLSSVISEVK